MMLPDDDAPRPKKGLEPRNLEVLSVEEMREYQRFLALENERIEQAIAQRGDVLRQAESFFKK